jgi:hypothetical protein
MGPGSGIPAGRIGCLTARAIAGNRTAATMKFEPNQMSPAPLILSFLISNKLDPATSNSQYQLGDCRTSGPALYSVQRECDL